MRNTTAWCVGLTCAFIAVGCAEDEGGTGTLAVEVWGEEFIEEGNPTEVFSDGWSVTFDRFLVAIDGVAVTGSTEIDNLWDFIAHLTGTLGHIDGEHHCEVE